MKFRIGQTVMACCNTLNPSILCLNVKIGRVTAVTETATSWYYTIRIGSESRESIFWEGTLRALPGGIEVLRKCKID